MPKVANAHGKGRTLEEWREGHCCLTAEFETGPHEVSRKQSRRQPEPEVLIFQHENFWIHSKGAVVGRRRRP